MEWLISLLTVCAPILVALVGIIPTIISNRKQTQKSLSEMQDKIISDIKDTKAEVSDVRDRLDEHIAEDEENRAKQARYRILRFGDEVCKGIEHSESHWEDILDDIDFYEAYCEKHPEFKNSRGHAIMEYLRETYKKIKAKGGFLTHE